MWRFLSILALAAGLAGCGRKGPPELTLEQIPEAIKTVFASARPALRTNAEGVAMLVTGKQYPAVSLQLQALAANSELTDEQRTVIASATIAVNRVLQEIAASAPAPAEESAVPGATPAAPAATADDAAAAAAVLEHHLRTK